MQDLLTSILAPMADLDHLKQEIQVKLIIASLILIPIMPQIKKVERTSNKPFEQRKFDGFKKRQFL